MKIFFSFQKRERVKRSRKGEVCQLILKVLVAPIVPKKRGVTNNCDAALQNVFGKFFIFLYVEKTYLPI